MKAGGLKEREQAFVRLMGLGEDCLIPTSAALRAVSRIMGTEARKELQGSEGRMALADALALAGREKPGLILDYATLTGACYGAVSPRYSGVFSNRAALTPADFASFQVHGWQRPWVLRHR